MVTSPFVCRVAKGISVLGHPLLILPLVFTCLAFQHLPVRQATAISAALISLVILPITWHTYRKVKQGKYTNFDLSDQAQRSGLYPILLILSGLFILFLFFTNQFQPFNRGAVCFFLLLVSSYAINFFLKISLHTSISFFLACILYSLSAPFGSLMCIFSVLVAASRLVLKRHSLSEILSGILVGLMAGAGL
ncbi:hypothetical protein [Spirosoma jeollabukense]